MDQEPVAEVRESAWAVAWIGADDRARLGKTYGVCDEDLDAAAHLYELGQRETMLFRKLRSLATVAPSGQIVFLSPQDAQRLADELDLLWAARNSEP
jgi:hypothetical protein